MTDLPWSDRIYNARTRAGLTQAVFAHRLDVTLQTVSNWETGATEPWPREQRRVLACLIDLLGEIPPPGVAPPLNEKREAAAIEASYARKPKRQPVGDRI